MGVHFEIFLIGFDTIFKFRLRNFSFVCNRKNHTMFNFKNDVLILCKNNET